MTDPVPRTTAIPALSDPPSPVPVDIQGMRLLLSMAPILLALGLTAAFVQAVFVH